MSRRRGRTLRRAADGTLTDERSQQVVTLAELRDALRDGRRFRVLREDDSEATFAVLAEIMTGREPGLPSTRGRTRLGDLLGGPLSEVLDRAGVESDLSGPRRSAPRSGAGRARRRPPRAEGR
jgi:hypothetical protein